MPPAPAIHGEASEATGDTAEAVHAEQGIARGPTHLPYVDLTQSAMVQRKAAGAPLTREAPTDIAARGVAGAAAPLPYRDAIQASFGRHDISQVRTATGGAAAESAGELGASAFAVGDRVGFAHAPDLHTAAHEAAHVVQQRAGVQLRGGIDGGASDPYEQHADRVADKVVRGESAEALLDTYAGAGGAPAVQRKTETPSGMVNARRYLELNAFRTGEVIAQHLLQQRLPQPHPRLEWRNEKLFYQKLLRGLSGIWTFQSPFDVAQLLAPGDPYGIVDQLRPLTKAVEAPDGKDDMKGGPVGPWTWSAPVGFGIAQLVEQALIDSMYRLGPRYLAIAETLTSGSSTVAPEDIARSHPMDRFTVGPMCQPGVFAVVAEGSPKTKPAAAKRDPKRPVTLTWVGRENKELWNWVRASPADATVEEVSAALFEYMTTRDHEARADYYATFLTAAPPMFGIPPQWAKTFEETRPFRPAQIAGADTDPDHQIVVLGGSSQADAQALAEIGVVSPDPKATSKPHPPNEHDNLVADATAQATALKGMLAGWKLGDAAGKTLAFLARRRTDGANAAKWLPVLSAQRENLTRISSGILQLNAAVDQMKLSKTGEQAAPLREIMRFYADATACAHLHQSCNRLILRAANAQMSLTARGLGASLQDMDRSVDMMRTGVAENDYDRKQLSATASRLREQGTAMQTRMMRGGNVPAEEIEELQIRVEEAALDAKLTAVDFSLRQLESAANEAGAGLAAWFASRFSSKFRGLPEATQKIRDQITDIRFEWNKAKRYADMPDDNAEVHERANLRKAVEAAKQKFAELAKQQDINEFLREGASIVQWQQFRTVCVKLAALIGISLVGSLVGGMLARGAAGMMMGTGGAAAMQNLSLGGAIVARGAGLVTEAAIQSAGQSLIFGDKLGMAFLENLIMNAGSAAVLKALGSKVEEAARLEKATQSLWQKGAAAGKVVIKEAAALSGHAIMGAAMGYVAHKIVTGKNQPSPATLEEWLMQGAGIAVGRYVGKAIEASHARQKQLKLQGHGPSQQLATSAEKLAALAKRVETQPQPKDAMELLEKRHELLTEELKVLDEIAKSPELLKQSGMSHKEIERARAAIKHQLAEVHAQGFGDVPLHLAGLKELIPGSLWSGTESQILDAIRTAHESGINIKAKPDPQGGRWHLEIEGRKIEVEQRLVSPAKTVDVERVLLAGDDAELRRAVKLVPPKDGALDVIVHGTVDDFIVMANGEKLALSHRSLAKYIEKSDLKYKRIRLLACSSGMHPKGSAQHLANKLGVTVEAPSDKLFIHPDGTLTIGPSESRNTGKWLEFTPRKSESRYQRAAEPERPATERTPEARTKVGPKKLGPDEHPGDTSAWLEQLKKRLLPDEVEQLGRLRNGWGSADDIEKRFGGDIEAARVQIARITTSKATQENAKRASQQRAVEIRRAAEKAGALKDRRLAKVVDTLADELAAAATEPNRPKRISKENRAYEKAMEPLRTRAVGELLAAEALAGDPGACCNARGSCHVGQWHGQDLRCHESARQEHSKGSASSHDRRKAAHFHGCK